MKTKEQIIKEADRLFYEKGFEKTSFADIAGRVNISRGNFYHHFKSKDEILSSVIDYRIEKTKKLLAKWAETASSPEERIKKFINILITNMTKIKLYGCPAGTLVTELSKLDHSSKKDANGIFTVFRDWLGSQFFELGFKKESDELAMHVLSSSQGVATLANAFRDEKFINNEVRFLVKWLDEKIRRE